MLPGPAATLYCHHVRRATAWPKWYCDKSIGCSSNVASGLRVLATSCEPTGTLNVHFEILIHDHTTTIYYWPPEALPRGGHAEENVRPQLISWISVTIKAFKFQSTNKYKSIGTSFTYVRTPIFYTNVCADKTRKAIQKSTIQTIQDKQIYIEM